MAKQRNMDLERIIQDGEGSGPGGFVAQTANGSGHWRGEGWNKSEPYTSPMVAPDPTRPAGRNNRTAE